MAMDISFQIHLQFCLGLTINYQTLVMDPSRGPFRNLGENSTETETYFRSCPHFFGGVKPINAMCFPKLLCISRCASGYPLVNVHISTERFTIFHAKTHYFDWAIFNSELLVITRYPVAIFHYRW